jgi:hypothetical protein
VVLVVDAAVLAGQNSGEAVSVANQAIAVTWAESVEVNERENLKPVSGIVSRNLHPNPDREKPEQEDMALSEMHRINLLVKICKSS